jgi:hypothetical protein
MHLFIIIILAVVVAVLILRGDASGLLRLIFWFCLPFVLLFGPGFIEFFIKHGH